jgi:hypothetical protein
MVNFKIFLSKILEQRDEIKKMSLARLICNDFTVNDIQQNVFLLK